MHSPRLIELLVRGDCACGFNDPDALEQVCKELDSLVPNMAVQVARVAYWVPLDMRAAAQFWARLATDVRTGSDELSPSREYTPTNTTFT